jgi:hypothetical protein
VAALPSEFRKGELMDTASGRSATHSINQDRGFHAV